ncbi:MAG: hypothetical protein K2X47_17515 [Bdellovibrionales bacterium]|nr:hypothetical protein [Bdellovibrionales bacterium]
MKFLGLALLLIGSSAIADSPMVINHHVSKFQIWCDVAASADEAITALNAKIESGGHTKHHLNVLHVSAPSVSVDSHEAKHHQTRACATVHYSESH